MPGATVLVLIEHRLSLYSCLVHMILHRCTAAAETNWRMAQANNLVVPRRKLNEPIQHRAYAAR